MLTEQQSFLLRFIESRLTDGDVSPSFEEMRVHLGLRSKSGIHRLLESLRERGCVVRLPNRARSLRVVRRGGDGGGDDRGDGGGDDRGDGGGGGERREQEHEIVRLPFLGGVAAGLPIEAVGVAGWDEEREYPNELLGRKGYGRKGYGKNYDKKSGEDVRLATHYALRVEGDSMVGVGILDGDTVIVEACDDARDGELVIALVDEGEATLKILRKRDGEVVLEAANEAYGVQRYAAERVRVQGRVTGLMRRYARS